MRATLPLAVSLVSACSSGGTSTGASSPSAKSSGPVTIDYLHRLPDGEGMTKVANIVTKWNAAHPGIQVKATKFNGKAPEMIVKLDADVKASSSRRP